ncbi:hypothetical protein BVX98_05655 [bacterium F11]|nr:hypothetical protein BVX98_05655 [bacterium F11]
MDNKKEQKQSQSEIIAGIAKSLNQRRMSKGLSLIEASRSLKIRVPLLKDLEKGNWDQIPGGVYLIGFLRQYAQFLGLDPDKLLAPYVRLTSEPIIDEDEQPQSTAEQDHQTRVMWISAGLGVLFILGFVKFLSVDSSEKGGHKAPKTTVAALEEPVTKKIEESKTEENALPEHTLEVFTPYPLWLGVEAEDGHFEGFIPEGSTWSWSAGGNFAIRLGHTRELVVHFDGVKVPINEDQKRVFLPHDN